MFNILCRSLVLSPFRGQRNTNKSIIDVCAWQAWVRCGVGVLLESCKHNPFTIMERECGENETRESHLLHENDGNPKSIDPKFV